MSGQTAQRTGPLAFFSRRWRREVPLGTLFWRDMALVGTTLNLVTSFVSLMALGFKADPAVAMAIYLAPLPYNVFLTAAVWRTADRVEPATATQARLGAAVWLVLATLI